MNIQHTLPENTNSSKLQTEADIRFHGRWLVIARAVWGAMAALVLVLIVFSIPAELKFLQTVCTSAGCNGPQFLPEQARELKNLGLSLNFYAAYLVTLELAFFMVWFIVAALIFWRKSNERMPWFVSFTLLMFGATFPDLLGSLANQQHIWLVPITLIEFLGVTCIVLLFYLFPNGRFVPRWTRFLAVVCILSSLLAIVQSFYLPNYVLLGGGAIAQIYRYFRVSNHVQKQQTKWVLYGFTIAIMGFLLLVGLDIASFILHFSWIVPQNPILPFIIQTAYYLFIVLIPLSIGIAILRYRLWEIDVLINRTLVYGLLTAFLALLYFGLIVVLQFILRGLVNQNDVSIVVSTLAIAALFQPLRRRIQNIIDRRFFRRKYDATRTLAAFSATLRNEVELDELSEHLFGSSTEDNGTRACIIMVAQAPKGRKAH